MATEIDLIQLKKIIDRLFKHIIDTRGVKTLIVEQTDYWNIPSSVIYNSKTDSNDLNIGNLADDWEFLSSLLDEENQPVAFQLTELAPLIRYIGEVLGEELAKDGG